jgi:hypothetical protein
MSPTSAYCVGRRASGTNSSWNTNRVGGGSGLRSWPLWRSTDLRGENSGSGMRTDDTSEIQSIRVSRVVLVVLGRDVDLSKRGARGKVDPAEEFSGSTSLPRSCSHSGRSGGAKHVSSK